MSCIQSDTSGAGERPAAGLWQYRTFTGLLSRGYRKRFLVNGLEPLMDMGRKISGCGGRQQRLLQDLSDLGFHGAAMLSGL